MNKNYASVIFLSPRINLGLVTDEGEIERNEAYTPVVCSAAIGSAVIGSTVIGSTVIGSTVGSHTRASL